VYADLFSNYLNYFLPIGERDVSFPLFMNESVELNTTQQVHTSSEPAQPIASPSSSTSPSSSPLSHKHASIFKRHLQKNITQNNSDCLSATLDEPDRISDKKKIDLVLRMLVECLLYAFADTRSELEASSSSKADPCYSRNNNDSIDRNSFLNRSWPGNSSSSLSIQNASFAGADEISVYLCRNIDIIFALGMLVKHVHLFLNAGILFRIGKQLSSSPLKKQNKLNDIQQYETTLDEFRA
jgi:hypothetical protein